MRLHLVFPVLGALLTFALTTSGALASPSPEAAAPRLEDFPPDPDRDEDGLSDFQEIHKYRTDPDEADTDGDGTPDGDWNERREHTYSIRTVVRVMPPVDEDSLCDDYQDALVLRRRDDFIELEVVHYPLNTCADAITETRNWRRVPDELRRYLEPGPTTNWDEEMRGDLLRDLAAAGIALDELSDRAAVKAVASWALQRAKSLQTFTTYLVHCPDGEVEIYPGLEEKFERKKYRDDWSVQDQFDHEVLGKGMYDQCTRGSCTSSAVYLSTVLRAAGIPTRMLLAIPCVDASNPDELKMAERGMEHHEVRETVLAGLRPLENAFAAHTFNEVWVGGRWRRLNYDHLGQNTLSRNCFGLLTKVNTFHDLADANLAATWGTCSLTGWNSSSFLHSNPYSARSLDDRFGAHAELPNPPAQSREHFHADIVKAYWHDSDQDRPDFIGRDAVADDDNGHVFLEARHWIEDEGIAQYRRFWQAADKEFVLKAEGRRDVKASAERGHWRNHFYIQIPAAQMRHLAAGVAYRLVPRNRNSDHQWRIDEDVRIVGRGADGPPPPATTAGEVTTTRPDSEHRSLTIGRLRDFHDPSIPDWIRDTELPQDGSRHLLAEVAEWIPGQDGDQLILFTERADSEVSFVARGEKTVRGVVLQGCMNSTDGEIRLVWVMVDPGEARKIEAGVEYRLKPRNKGSRYRWKVSDAARFTWE